MKISSRFTVAVHILSLVAIESNELCTSEWIAESVNTNPVVIRRIIGKLRNAGLIQVRQGLGGATLQKPLKDITFSMCTEQSKSLKKASFFNFMKNQIQIARLAPTLRQF